MGDTEHAILSLVATRPVTQDILTDELVLDLSNSQSCVFNTMLRILSHDWLKMVHEKGGKILELFKLELVIVGKMLRRST